MHDSFWKLLSPAWPIVSGVQAIAWGFEDGNAQQKDAAFSAWKT